ncbi:MAG: hypothetical protein XE08_0283 [Parcubacteria bacterium 32_520]|nr:MAG: hypothetical protein XE08_0283 [Parcubacteria bacterium 32_520]
MTNIIADKGYLAVKPQLTANTPVIPSIFLPYITDSVITNQNFVRDMRLFGIDWSGLDILRGAKEHSGSIEFYLDPFTTAHFLNMGMKKGTTTNDGGTPPVYTHPFTAEDSKLYTIEFSVGGYYTRRYFDVRLNTLDISIDNGKIKGTANIQAGGEWSVRNLKTALSGAVTSLTFDQKYSNYPAKGLVAGDILKIGSVEVTILTVSADFQSVTFASTSITASAGTPVYLKCQIPSYAGKRPVFMFENMIIGSGANATEANTNATCTKQTQVNDITFSFNNNLLTEPLSGDDCGPRNIQATVKEASLTIRRLFSDISQVQKWINAEKQAFVIKILGTYGNNTTREELKIIINNAKLITNNNPINQGGFVYDEQEFAVLYDEDDAQAIKVELSNLEDGSDY